MEHLNAISPIDGRYHNQTSELIKYFSESALIKYRIQIEVEYLIKLTKALDLPNKDIDTLKTLYTDFWFLFASKIKSIENITNHDVKAVEYFIKEYIEKSNLKHLREFVHFGLTSQDINNTAIPLLLKDWLNEIFIFQVENLIQKIEDKFNLWEDIPMLARTHGQPATPTTLGKEFRVFQERLTIQLQELKSINLYCKFGGATGNLNAHYVAYPNTNWIDFSNEFANSLGLHRSQHTTQIDHYDSLSKLFDNLKRINTILLDFCQDIWLYISMDYFKQKTKENEVGSSAMPHKVNPIDFENAEGNLGLANALFIHLSSKLPISRLQRDLTDSTVIRNIGVPISHTHIAFKSILKGLDKLILNQDKINQDLNDNWIVVSEGVQTILRRENYPNPYEELKKLTRGKQINQETILDFIDNLEISNSIKEELKKITPFNYTGI